MAKKYSVADIDRMRAAISFDRTVNVEERLRTYMLNGSTPEELEAHCAALKAALDEMDLISARVRADIGENHERLRRDWVA